MTSEQGVEKTQKHFTKKHELHLTTLQVAAVESMEKKYKRGVEENLGREEGNQSTHPSKHILRLNEG